MWGCRRTNSTKSPASAISRAIWAAHRRLHALNFLFRQGQTHRSTLTAHANHANPFFERQLNAMTQNFVAIGPSTSEASHRALAQLSAQIDLQANVLGFVNAFWMLGLARYVADPAALHHAAAEPGRSKSLSSSALTARRNPQIATDCVRNREIKRQRSITARCNQGASLGDSCPSKSELAIMRQMKLRMRSNCGLRTKNQKQLTRLFPQPQS